LSRHILGHPGLILKEKFQNLAFCLDGGIYGHYHQGWAAGKQSFPAFAYQNRGGFC
jgi:hypothetical protein